MVVINYAFHFTSFVYTNSLTLFECGVDVQKYKQTSFSLQFFMIGLIFILFDLEIIFLVCIIITNNLYSYLCWLLLFIVFIYITLLYE
jgi:NADH:ubiquinone oxidoreductase subunit 3 (subunit A)